MAQQSRQDFSGAVKIDTERILFISLPQLRII